MQNITWIYVEDIFNECIKRMNKHVMVIMTDIKLFYGLNITINILYHNFFLLYIRVNPSPHLTVLSCVIASINYL